MTWAEDQEHLRNTDMIEKEKPSGKADGDRL